MASESVSEQETLRALERLTRVQGIVACATKMLDKHLSENWEWEISEALHGALDLLSGCYSTLSDALEART